MSVQHVRQVMIIKFWKEECRLVICYGRAGFHSPSLAVTQGRREYFLGHPRPAPSAARLCSFPGQAPIPGIPFLIGTCPGHRWGRDRGGECQKTRPAPGW